MSKGIFGKEMLTVNLPRIGKGTGIINSTTLGPWALKASLQKFHTYLT